MSSDVLISGDVSHATWINIALGYLPEEILKDEGANLAIIGLGRIGGCQVPEQYRQRELVLLSDWIFPPPGHSEGDESGQFFIVTLLHEIAHAIRRHKSPALDELTFEEEQSQQEEADSLAISWYNHEIKLRNDQFLKAIQTTEFREIVERYANLCDEIEKFKFAWHQDRKKGKVKPTR